MREEEKNGKREMKKMEEKKGNKMVKKTDKERNKIK